MAELNLVATHNLFFKSSNINEHIYCLNNELLAIKNWCTSNKLTLNVDKTNFMLLKYPQNKFHLDNTHPFFIFNKPIFQTDHTKFLGIFIDSNLSWKKHIEYLIKQLRPLSGLLYRTS